MRTMKKVSSSICDGIFFDFCFGSKLMLFFCLFVMQHHARITISERAVQVAETVAPAQATAAPTTQAAPTSPPNN